MNQRQSALKDHEQNGKPDGYLSIDVPMTANELERWLVANQSIAATELYDAGYCAWLSLRAMEAGPAHQSKVMDAMNRRDLLAFVAALRANSVKGETK
jgi:hypothetical protein